MTDEASRGVATQTSGPRRPPSKLAPETSDSAGTVRVRVRDPLGMTDEALARVVSGIRSRPHGNCTDLYRWLHARYTILAAELQAHRPSWRTVAQDIGADGITGRFGAPLTARTVRRVWVTVCRDIEASKVAAEMERMTGMRPGAASRPKKLPTGWIPPSYLEPNAPPPSGGVHQGGQPAALPSALPRQPDPSPPTGARPDTSRPAGGSVEAAWQRVNQASSLRPNGDPIHKRS